ncbi:BRO family protein [Megamonas funiformis]|uniref:BRO family protein n=1 Tax=Megamonas funiformis TaxID=437897 RepID=UPI0035201E7D
MNELQIFNSPEFGQVRTIVKNDEVWFVGRDVAEALGYELARKAILDHVEKEDKEILSKNQTFQNGTLEIPNRGLTIINESGLYSLALSSKLPKAKQFKRWITKEVIPSIRKHGMYMTSSVAQQAINNPTEFLARAVLVANQELDKLKMENAVMKPKADYFDELVDRNTLTNFRDTSKMLHIGQKYFINWLLERKFVYRNVKGKLQPYSQFIASDSNSKGYFEVKEQKAKDDSWSGIQTLITPRGREAFRLLLSQKLIAG